MKIEKLTYTDLEEYLKSRWGEYWTAALYKIAYEINLNDSPGEDKKCHGFRQFIFDRREIGRAHV